MLWKDSKDYTIERFTLDEPASFIETPVDTAGPFVLDGLDASGIVMPYIPEAYAESRDDDWPRAKADEAKADGNGAREGFPFTGYEALRIDISKPWLIKGVMAKRETSSWIAPPGRGKSALLTEVAVHVASGRDWRGYKTKQKAAVIIFALERGDLLKRRLEAYKRKHGLCDLPIAVVTAAVDIMSPNCIPTITATIRTVEKHYGCQVGLIIFDTFAKALAVGGGDEDKAKDQSRALGHLRVVQEETDVHVAFVGHTGKDESRGARGSSAHPGDADLMVQISGDDAVKSAVVIKANDQPEGPLTSFTLEPFKLGIDEDGDSIDVGIVSDEIPEAPKKKEARRGRQSDRDRNALKALHDALAEGGEPVPANNHIPQGVRVVTVELWRKYAYQSGMSPGDTPEARKKAFQRAAEALQANKLIGIWEPHVWTIHAK